MENHNKYRRNHVIYLKNYGKYFKLGGELIIYSIPPLLPSRAQEMLEKMLGASAPRKSYGSKDFPNCVLGAGKARQNMLWASNLFRGSGVNRQA